MKVGAALPIGFCLALGLGIIVPSARAGERNAGLHRKEAPDLEHPVDELTIKSVLSNESSAETTAHVNAIFDSLVSVPTQEKKAPPAGTEKVASRHQVFEIKDSDYAFRKIIPADAFAELGPSQTK
jgi:hypothetical protein